MTWSLARLSAVMVLASLGLSQDPRDGAFRFDRNNKENVVASRLQGTWVADADITKRLGGHRQSRELTFTFDWSAIPDEAFAKLGKAAAGKGMRLTVYAAGKVVGLSTHTSPDARSDAAGDHGTPFFLTSLYGTPRIIWFREKNGDPFGDSESFNVMLAVGAERKSDLLFRGGDFNNQPFTTYRRKASK